MEYRVKQVPFIPASYQVAAAVYDEFLLTPYDHWEQCWRFAVLEEATDERFGVVTLEANWRLSNERASEDNAMGEKRSRASAD